MRLLTDESIYKEIAKEYDGTCGYYDSLSEAAYDFERIVDRISGIDMGSIMKSLKEEISHAYKLSQNSPRADFYTGCYTGIQFAINVMKHELKKLEG